MIADPELEAERVAALVLEGAEVAAAVESRGASWPRRRRRTRCCAIQVSPSVKLIVRVRARTSSGGIEPSSPDQRPTPVYDDVVELPLAVQFGGQPQAPARREARAEAPAQSVRQIDVVRIAADDEAAEAGELDALR